MMRAVGLKTHIWNNQLRSGLLLAGFPVLLALLCFALSLFLAADNKHGPAAGLREALRVLPGVIVFALVASALWFAIAWKAHQWILDVVTGARPVTRAAEPRLWNTLENLCIARGLPVPRLTIMETAARNAFASGLSPDKASVAVTRGLLDALDDRELAAVLGHELTHIRNGDARLAVIAAVFAGIISLTAELMLRGVRFGAGSSSRSGGKSGGAGWLALLAVAIAALAWGLAAALRLALSRNREFLADAGAAELTQDPDAMITALRKVAGHSDVAGVPAQVRAMFLDDAEGTRGSWMRATHPPLEARIDALVRFAGGRDPGPLPEVAPTVSPPGTQERPAPLPPGAAASSDLPQPASWPGPEPEARPLPVPDPDATLPPGQSPRGPWGSPSRAA
ncbi:M48 family metalloprotease [Roseomonas sp. BN140053]|uniref:M48 family metalloprotease n=1 Tax=Roseomonas sp. BN140053 TaxID=3391898 RepID=UPI0039E7785E